MLSVGRDKLDALFLEPSKRIDHHRAAKEVIGVEDAPCLIGRQRLRSKPRPGRRLSSFIGFNRGYQRLSHHFQRDAQMSREQLKRGEPSTCGDYMVTWPVSVLSQNLPSP